MIIETILLLAFRGALFFGCRRYILRILYEDLQELSSTSGEAETIELSLPTSSSSIVQKSQKTMTREERHTSISHSTFALCFTESCTLFLLLMFQGLDIFTPGIRVLHFRICLLLLLLIILLAVPLLFSYIHLTAFTIFYIDLMTACLSRLIVVGTIILGALSGFGAMRSCWLYLLAQERYRYCLSQDRDIEVSTAALARIREDLKARMDEATRKGNNETAPWYSRVVKTFGSDDISQEIAGLEALEYQMALALDDKRERQRAHRRSRTLYGRAWNLGGKVFAVYCVIRILSVRASFFLSIINLAFPTLRRTSSSTPSEYNYPDLVAYLVSLLLPYPQERVVAVSRQVGLVFVGLIILSSIRLVLRSATRVLRVTSRNRGASLMMLLLAQLIGIYLLSTIVQLRTSFPPPSTYVAAADDDQIPDGKPTNLFSLIPEGQVFGGLFDASFLLAAVAEGIVVWIGDKFGAGSEYDA
ncbi:G protein-coupled receptor 89 [Armillaria luteobubalina]|uniref:G protein-coupled receptor 89 n=1 Tax=Armillaria luteobubalina TaxID=153913 RepID=A0AA39PFC6_9AGAR|nr:G protein-coupled receptor 89 [Armillaria luteobubalina]